MSATSPAASETMPKATKSLRVLYADDVRELRRLLEISLGNDGHRVETVPDGRAALERVLAGVDDFDLIITDHHMPNMNGLEFVTRLRGSSYRGRIMVFSSELNENVSDAYRALGVDCILPKPVFPLTLRSIIATF
jgi:two-component system, chemotaxis family, chemotaxis protein CheY